MKNLLIIAFTLIFISCKAQTVYNLDIMPGDRVSDNYYIKDINNQYDAIVGVWKWQQGNDSFEITLQKFTKYSYHDNHEVRGF